jgi:uncharacterized membrane protein
MAADIARKIVIASFRTPKGAEQTLALIGGANVRLGKSAVVGAIAGLLLPGVETLTLAVGGALAAYFIDLGFPDALLKQMGEGLAADSSML